MLLRESFTAVRRCRGGVPLTSLRHTTVWTKPRYSTVRDGSSGREQTQPPHRHDSPRNTVVGAHESQHPYHARLLKLYGRYGGAAPSPGRRSKSRNRSATRSLHESTRRPSRSLPPMSTAKTRDATCTSPPALDTVQMLDAVLALSSALYEDEAAAMALRVDEAKASNNAAEQAASSQEVSRVTSSGAVDDLEGVKATSENVYASLDAENLMTLMEACTEGYDDKRDVCALQSDVGTMTPAPSLSSTLKAQPSSTGTPSSSILGTFAAPEVPLERKVLQFMDLCSNTSATPQLGGCDSDATSRLPWNVREGMRCDDSTRDLTTSAATEWSPSTAAALVLPGLDMKAVLAHGVLENRHLRGLSLVRCDFSLVRWSHMTVEDCDLSSSLFYGAELDAVVFRRCNFTGCILKGVQCRSSLSTTTRFEDCDFRLAAVGLTCVPRNSKQAVKDGHQGQGSIESSSRRSSPSMCFLRCNFDLSDFQFSQGLDKAEFVKCSNTRLASRFPLRSRGRVG
ncbi:hypothetical protein, conserved [Leishmania tarentolae]|uniref:Pentapeptide repeat protein n=1 Tax=Leishmania tarentolae TaxID=5689 RepID=A0A640KPN9_LEITA|nr:hypothetical protein, conserved [Leishmania tarentolae]